MRHVLVSYDVADDDRRNALSKTLEGFGMRVQFSVFECYIKDEDLIRMEGKIDGIVNKGEDSVFIINLCAFCYGQVKRIGVHKEQVITQGVTVI